MSTTSARRQSQLRIEKRIALDAARRKAKRLSASRAFHVTRLGSTENQKRHAQSKNQKPKVTQRRADKHQNELVPGQISKMGGAFRKNKNAPKGGAPVIPSQKSGIRGLLRTGARRARLVSPPGADPRRTSKHEPTGQRQGGMGRGRTALGRATPLTNRGTKQTNRSTTEELR